MCKVIYGDASLPEEKYEPAEINDSFGTHYSSVPLSFQKAVAEKFQSERPKYGKEGTHSIFYDNSNNNWILDCWGSEAINAYLWMDEDVYKLYFYSSIQGPVPYIYNSLEERNMVYTVCQQNGKQYWEQWKADCIAGESVTVPVPGTKGFVEFDLDNKEYDHIIEVLPPGEYNGAYFEHPIRSMADADKGYQIYELYDYNNMLLRSDKYIAAWGVQSGTAVEKDGIVEQVVYKPEQKNATTNKGKLNVRFSFSTSSPKLKTLKKGEKLTVLKEGFTDEEGNEWCQVLLTDGKQGYIMSQFLTFE